MDWTEATCFLNGEWRPLAGATVSVLDRGFIFGDGVYEVIPVDTVAGVRAPYRAREHFERLQRSCDAIGLANPYPIEQWLDLLDEIVERHPWPRQTVYVQLTRGAAKRDHAFPAGVAPTVFVNASPWAEIPAEQIEGGVAVVTHADERWLHCDIKSVSLLGNVLMRQYAIDHRAFETVMLRDGFLTEASSANVMMIKGGCLHAPRKSVQILPGITCDATYDLARRHGLAPELRPIATTELGTADELWLSSSGREVLPITVLDGRPVGDGRPGPVYRQMRTWFAADKHAEALRWAERRAAGRARDVRAA
ncbi:MAG TPA: aminotransferase class IV [Burkholderiaceae bacterium]|nr:aminotransferase class IV [Burkholderiaceae bacterium]